MYRQLYSVFTEQFNTDNFSPHNNNTSLHPKLQSPLMTIFDISLLNDDNLNFLSASFKVAQQINFYGEEKMKTTILKSKTMLVILGIIVLFTVFFKSVDVFFCERLSMPLALVFCK